MSSISLGQCVIHNTDEIVMDVNLLMFFSVYPLFLMNDYLFNKLPQNCSVQFLQITLCLDIDNLPEYSISEKFAGFVTRYEKYKDFALKTSFRISPTYKGKLDFDIVKTLNKKEITDTRALLKTVHRDSKGVNLAGYTLIESLEEMLYFEFIELLKQGLHVKKGKLCGKYFVLTSKHDADFCDRIYKGHWTCKQVGAKKTYNERVAADPISQGRLTEMS